MVGYAETGTAEEYWFSRETGMLDFVSGRKLAPADGENLFFNASAIAYYANGGVYYPERISRYQHNYLIRSEHSFSDLAVQIPP